MKQVVDYLIFAVVLTAFVIVASIIPPTITNGQPVKDTVRDTVSRAKFRSDSVGLEAVKWLKDIEKESTRIDSLSEQATANKVEAQKIRWWVRAIIKKSKVKTKVVPIHYVVPVPVKTGEVSNIIVNSYTAPVIQGTKIRDYPTYIEWKDSRGLIQRKDYKTYLKKVYGK